MTRIIRVLPNCSLLCKSHDRISKGRSITLIRGKRTTSGAGALDAALKGKSKNTKLLSDDIFSGETTAKRVLSRKQGSNYNNTMPPPIYPSPPPPPPRKGIRRYVLPFTLLVSAAVAVFVLTLEDDEDDDFWKDVESGRILLDDEDEDEEE